MTDQLLGWLAHVDGVLLALTSVFNHLAELIDSMVRAILAGLSLCGLCCLAWRSRAGKGSKVRKTTKRRRARRPRANNRT